MEPSKRRLTFRLAFYTGALFVGLVFLFTVVGALSAPPLAQVGGTRPTETIPTHLAALAGFGVLLGVGAGVLYGRDGFPLVLLMPALVVLLDLDHLPAYLGYAEPIRPAHSLIFLAAALGITAIVIRRLDVDLVVLSAVMGHMGVDSGLFAPLSPLSFDYYQLDPYRWPLLVGAVLAALAAGLVVRRSRPVMMGAD